MKAVSVKRQKIVLPRDSYRYCRFWKHCQDNSNQLCNRGYLHNSAWCLFKAADIKPALGQWVMMPLAVGVLGGVLGNLLSGSIGNTVLRLTVSLAVQVAVILFSCLIVLWQRSSPVSIITIIQD